MGERQDSEYHLFANTLTLPRFQHSRECTAAIQTALLTLLMKSLKELLFFLLAPHRLLLPGLCSGVLKTLLHKGKVVGTPCRIWLPTENPRSKEATLLGLQE